MNTRMLTTGAYSKKYQQLERVKAQHVRDQERRTSRERALLLSKQTAQRQKALEEKKRAMAVAEEQRRRKALEERRKAQVEATARFKSAMCRIKSNPRPKHKPMDNVEIYLPDKAKTGKPKSSSDAFKVQQRVAYGRDVEVSGNGSGGHTGLQRRTPSLDDVLNQIRGGGDKSSRLANSHPPANSKHTPHGHINVHHSSAAATSSTSTSTQHTADPDSAVNHTEIRNTPLLRGRSASDSNLNTLVVHRTSPAKAQQSLDNGHKDIPDAGSEADNLKLIEVESEVTPSNNDDVVVFKPVTTNVGSRGRQYCNHTTTSSSNMPMRMVQSDDGTRVVSPEPAESSSSSNSSFSPPPLNDSLDQPPSAYVVNSVAKRLKASRQQHGGQAGQERRRVKLTSHKRHDSGDSLNNNQSSTASLKVMGVPVVAHMLTPMTPPTSQPIYACQESESSSSGDDNDSLNEEGSYSHNRRAAHRSKNRHVSQTVETSVKAADNDSSHINECMDEPKVRAQGQSSSNADTTEAPVINSKPKIIGILKKTSSSSIESNQSMSSAGTVHMDRTPSKAKTGSQTSTASSVTKSRKRVRFIDQVATNNRRNITHTLHSDSMWNNVLPNGYSTHHLPNSAFTPRMRVLLSSKATTIPPAVSGPPKRPSGPSTLNGITVHVPVASVESPPSSCHPTLEQKSPQDSDSSEEDTTIDDNETQSSKQPDQNGASSKNVHVGNVTSPSHSQDAATSIEDNSTSMNGSSDRLSHAKAPSVTDKSLDKTPTDNEINEMWEQIKTCLEENKQLSSVPVQVYPFQMPTVNGMQRHGAANTRDVETDTSALSLQREQSQVDAPATSHCHQQTGKANEPSSGPAVRLVHRQSNHNRPMRCQHQPHNQAQLVRRHQNHTHHAHHNHSATYPHSNQEQSHQGQGQAPAHHQQLRVYPAVQTSSREPELVVRAMASPINGRTAPTSLSLEEQRLLQSIEKLNQRLKEHLVRPQEPVFHPPASPEPHGFPTNHFPHHPPPYRHHPPHNARSNGHMTDLPKSNSTSRVHWHQETTPTTAAAAINSRTQLRTITHRQNFYNT